MITSKIKHTLSAFAAISLAACASTQAPGTSPMDMSYAEHMAAATEEQEIAVAHATQYDPDKLVQEPDRDIQASGEIITVPGRTYNPTEKHKQRSGEHEALAKQHAAAAEALDNFKEKECADINVEIRHLCPLIGTVDHVEKVKGGARLHFKRDVDAEALYNHARCHYAFGAYHGHKEMPDCPLYLKNLKIELDDSDAMEITSDDESEGPEILRRAKMHVAP